MGQQKVTFSDCVEDMVGGLIFILFMHLTFLISSSHSFHIESSYRLIPVPSVTQNPSTILNPSGLPR